MKEYSVLAGYFGKIARSKEGEGGTGEEESTRRKSISGERKAQANCYAIKSRAASRDPRNARSFAFDSRRPNLADRDVFVMVLLCLSILLQLI